MIVRACRTAIGKENGMHRETGAAELAAPVISRLAGKLDVPIDDIILGNVVGPGGNVARYAALEAGLPLSVPGLTIDRQCSAGLDAIRLASALIKAEAGSCYIAGGTESASTSPFSERARFAPEAIGDPDMGLAAEHVARKFNISREEQDAYALLSHQRSWDSEVQGIFKQEIIEGRDEVFSKKREMEKLLKRARPLFDRENGTVTAANSCAINDGAAGVLIMEASLARRYGFTPVLRVVDSTVSGVHPHFPGAAPIPAIETLLLRNGLTVADIDLFEINEAFASKVTACAKALAIPYEKINIRGGALTLGHPYGASGAVLATRLFYEANRNPFRYAVAAIGSGGGVGVAVLFEVIH